VSAVGAAGGFGVEVAIGGFLVQRHWRSVSGSGFGVGSRGRLFSLRSVAGMGSLMG